ncbi:MAG: hypothetical protein MUO73_05250 [Thermoplasmata archaeon]|nr:hypothetical protein [Thermoplasmata archaeon]
MKNDPEHLMDAIVEYMAKIIVEEVVAKLDEKLPVGTYNAMRSQGIYCHRHFDPNFIPKQILKGTLGRTKK